MTSSSYWELEEQRRKSPGPLEERIVLLEQAVLELVEENEKLQRLVSELKELAR